MKERVIFKNENMVNLNKFKSCEKYLNLNKIVLKMVYYRN